MKDPECVQFLQWALPRLSMRWPGFRKVRKQVCKRVDRRIRQLQLASVAAYREYLEREPAEWKVLDAYCRISISRFYRDRGVFDFLRDQVLPDLAHQAIRRGDAELRCWSAGCASGEEPYTLNVIWKLVVQQKFPDVALRIVATDADETMLDRARRGCFSSSSLKDFPQPWLPRAMTACDDGWCVRDEFRKGIDFRLQDIRHAFPEGSFHMILCRHLVFTYFDEALQTVMLRRLTDRLFPDGVLVTGKNETLPCAADDLAPCGNRLGAYRKTEPR